MITRRSLVTGTLMGALALSGCEEEVLRDAVECTEEEPSFDITASSQLQLVHANAGVTDVIVLDSGLTNRSLLLELVSDSVFRDGPVTTRWLDRYVASRPGSEARSHLEAALAAAVRRICVSKGI